MKGENHVFHRDVWLLWTVFCSLEFLNAKKSDGGMVNRTLLRGKNLLL